MARSLGISSRKNGNAVQSQWLFGVAEGVIVRVKPTGKCRESKSNTVSDQTDSLLQSSWWIDYILRIALSNKNWLE